MPALKAIRPRDCPKIHFSYWIAKADAKIHRARKSSQDTKMRPGLVATYSRQIGHIAD
jgi:hypothetical protein